MTAAAGFDSNKTRTLLVGAGLMGVWHAQALSRLGIRPSGIVDTDEVRASGLARRAGGCPTFPSLSDALSTGSYDVAHVCTPLQSHGDLVRELLEARVHVLVEKPLTGAAVETEELLTLADRVDRLVCPVHQFLFQPGVLQMLSELDSAGPVIHVDMVAASAGAAGSAPHQAEEIMADILPHPLSLMRRLLGARFGSVTWHTAAAGAPGELRAAGVVDGLSLGILVSMRGRPTRNTLRVICERGTFHLDLFHGFVVREDPEVSRMRKIMRPFGTSAAIFGAATSNLVRRGMRREPAYPGLRELVGRFHGAARGGERPISVGEIVDVALARDALLRLRGAAGVGGSGEDE